MARGKSQVNEKEMLTCQICGNSKPRTSTYFYKSPKPEHTDLYGGFYPYDKGCLRGMACNKKGEITKESLKEMLKFIDRPFISEVYDKLVKEDKLDVGKYLNRIGMNTYWDMGYDDGDKENDELDEDLKEQEEEVSNSLYNDSKKNIEITDEDIKIQQDCIRLLGYDPFAGYSDFDRKFLYGELLPYLDEETLEDGYKISVIIQILNNNNQIRKIDLAMNRLSSDEGLLLKNSGELKGLSAIKNQIGQNNDRLSKENAIAIKHRGDKRAGKSTLGAMMKDLRELGFESAEEDYYDMKKAYGMEVTADISNKSILSQLNFDDKDLDDMLKEQRERLIQLQKDKLELEEKVRLLTIENLKLKEKIKVK